MGGLKDFLSSAGGGAIATGAVGLLGSIGSGRKAYHRSKKLMDKQFSMDMEAWKMQNAYNTPAQQMARLKEAGLNPALMYGQGTMGNATGAPQSKFTQLQPYMTAGDMGTLANSAIQGMLAKANKDLLKSQMFKNLSSSKLDDTNRFKINSLLGLEMDKMRSEIEFTKANTSLTRVTSELNNAKIDLTLDQRKQVQAQVEQVFKNIEVQDKMLEMDYSDNVGKNWMVNAEKLFGGQYDMSTYIGAAATVASLAILKNPVTLTRSKTVQKASNKITELYNKAKDWFIKKWNKSAVKTGKITY
jgi:hypothetical protein